MHQLNCYRNWLNLKINCFRCGSDLNVIGSGICPPEASGIFPNCKCSDGNVFDGVRKVCMSENRSLCPNGATGQRFCYFFFQMDHLKFLVFTLITCFLKMYNLGSPPNCNCGNAFAFDEIYWYCRPWYLSPTVQPCPQYC